MSKRKHAIRLAAVLAAVALTAAACGSGSDDSDATVEADTVGINDAGELPLADDSDSDDGAVVAAACAPGEPDCEDTLVSDTVVTDLPSTDQEEAPETDPSAVSSSGMPVDGGLTIPEALATDATGVLAVTGKLFGDETGVRLCEGLVGLGERYGCDGVSLPLDSLDLEVFGSAVVYHEGITYIEEPVTLFGEMVDGSFVLADHVA